MDLFNNIDGIVYFSCKTTAFLLTVYVLKLVNFSMLLNKLSFAISRNKTKMKLNIVSIKLKLNLLKCR